MALLHCITLKVSETLAVVASNDPILFLHRQDWPPFLDVIKVAFKEVKLNDSGLRGRAGCENIYSAG